MKLLDYTPLFQQCVDASRSNNVNCSRRWAHCKRKYDVFSDSEGQRRRDVVAGDTWIAHIKSTLDSFGVVRSNAQKRFHIEFTRACLPHIYGGADFEKQRERILAENSLEDVRYEVYVMCRLEK